MERGKFIKLMLVGCGVRGMTWARVVKENPDYEIAAYVDTDTRSIEPFYTDTSASSPSSSLPEEW